MSARGKLRQPGRFGGLITMPVRGSSGPGAQIPMPEIKLTDSERGLTAVGTESIAQVTAAKPAVASAAAIGTRVWWVISPVELTKPAATFVPPTSTPMKYCSPIRLKASTMQLHGFVISNIREDVRD